MNTSRHFLRFATIGALGTAAQYAVLIALVQGLQAHPVLGSQVGAVVGALVNYILNRRLNYRTARSHMVTGPRFAVVTLAGFVLNGLCMAVLTAVFTLHYVLAQVLTTAVVLAWNFTANHRWTFGGGR